MKQVAGFPNVEGTSTTSSALSRVQARKSGSVASEQTKISAVSIKLAPIIIVMGASSVSVGRCGDRRARPDRSSKQELDQHNHLTEPADSGGTARAACG